MTHRLYKDEYNEEFVYQIINNRIDGLIPTGEEGEKVIIVAGSEEHLQKLGGLMYAKPEQIKAVFPSFVTEKDYKDTWKRAFCDAFEAVRTELLDAIKKTDETGYLCADEHKALLNIFSDMRERVHEICK